jgi:hypothetical protein
VQADELRDVDERALGLRRVRRRLARHPLENFSRARRHRQLGADPAPLSNAVLISPSGEVVCERCQVVDSWLPQIRGLLGWHPPAASDGVLITPPPLLYAALARLSMDAVLLDDELTILAISEKPSRLAWKRRSHSLLELPPGRCEQLGLRPGDRFAWGVL